MYVQYKSSYADNKKLVEYLPCYRNDIRQSFSSINYIDKLVKSRKMPFSVIPSRIVVRDDGQAGIQRYYWMPDQVRQDQYRLLSRQVNNPKKQPHNIDNPVKSRHPGESRGPGQS